MRRQMVTTMYNNVDNLQRHETSKYYADIVPKFVFKATKTSLPLELILSCVFWFFENMYAGRIKNNSGRLFGSCSR